MRRYMFILHAVYIEVSQGKENKAESVQLLSSAKLVLKQLITRAKVSDSQYSQKKSAEND